MHCISVVGIDGIASAVIDVDVAAGVFDKLSISMEFSLFIEIHVAIPDTFSKSIAIATIDVTGVADVDAVATISVALSDFILVLAFIVFNVFIVIVGVIVGVNNSFHIAVTITVVAFDVVLALPVIVVDTVFVVVGVEVGFNFSVDFYITVCVVSFDIVVALVIANISVALDDVTLALAFFCFQCIHCWCWSCCWS